MTNDRLGPVELAVLTFPADRVAPTVVDALREVVDHGAATIIDLIYLAKTSDGDIVQLEVDEPLDDVGLGGLSVDPRGLVSDTDLDVVRETLEPGMSAVVVVYEQTWARELGATVAAAGGELALHVQIPRDAVDAALAAS